MRFYDFLVAANNLAEQAPVSEISFSELNEKDKYALIHRISIVVRRYDEQAEEVIVGRQWKIEGIAKLDLSGGELILVLDGTRPAQDVTADLMEMLESIYSQRAMTEATLKRTIITTIPEVDTSAQGPLVSAEITNDSI